MPDAVLTCLGCGGDYERPRRSMSHFCPECRRLNRIAKMADAQRRLADARREVRERADAFVAAGMTREYVETSYLSRLDEQTAELRSALHEGMVADRMPARSNHPAGPDEGTSTGWRDLAETLDQRAREAASHSWFVDNPHWHYELHDDDAAALERLRAS